MIETIRLERLSAQVANQNPLLKPDRTLFVPPHHTDVRAEPISSKPGVGVLGDRPWAEKRWNRPKTAGSLRVHSAKELQDMLTDERDEMGTSMQGSRLGSPLPGSPLPDGRASRGTPHEMASWGGSATSNANRPPQPSSRFGGRQRPQSAPGTSLAEERQRQRLRQQQEEQQERVMRKLRETQQAATAQKEADFHRAWEQFYSEQNGPVAEIEKMLRLKDMEFVRRANANCKAWNENVFDPIQEQIVQSLRKREARGSYNTRWRHAQDDYLRTLKKKDAGIFRDIVIEEEYDPLENANARITYSSKKANQKDPLKVEIRNHMKEAKMVPGSTAYKLMEQQANAKSERLDVKSWVCLDATPYGHFTKVLDKPPPTEGPHSSSGERVLGNHYAPPLPLEPKPIKYPAV